MISSENAKLVLVTAPNNEIARELAKFALERRLIACCNVIDAIESHYWWEGKLECESEVLILMKTEETRLDALEKLILQKHPYVTPEIVILSLERGTPAYLKWISESVKVDA